MIKNSKAMQIFRLSNNFLAIKVIKRSNFEEAMQISMKKTKSIFILLVWHYGQKINYEDDFNDDGTTFRLG